MARYGIMKRTVLLLVAVFNFKRIYGSVMDGANQQNVVSENTDDQVYYYFESLAQDLLKENISEEEAKDKYDKILNGKGVATLFPKMREICADEELGGPFRGWPVQDSLPDLEDIKIACFSCRNFELNQMLFSYVNGLYESIVMPFCKLNVEQRQKFHNFVESNLYIVTSEESGSDLQSKLLAILKLGGACSLPQWAYSRIQELTEELVLEWQTSAIDEILKAVDAIDVDSKEELVKSLKFVSGLNNDLSNMERIELDEDLFAVLLSELSKSQKILKRMLNFEISNDGMRYVEGMCESCIKVLQLFGDEYSERVHQISDDVGLYYIPNNEVDDELILKTVAKLSNEKIQRIVVEHLGLIPEYSDDNYEIASEEVDPIDEKFEACFTKFQNEFDHFKNSPTEKGESKVQGLINILKTYPDHFQNYIFEYTDGNVENFDVSFAKTGYSLSDALKEIQDDEVKTFVQETFEIQTHKSSSEDEHSSLEGDISLETLLTDDLFQKYTSECQAAFDALDENSNSKDLVRIQDLIHILNMFPGKSASIYVNDICEDVRFHCAEDDEILSISDCKKAIAKLETFEVKKKIGELFGMTVTDPNVISSSQINSQIKDVSNSIVSELKSLIQKRETSSEEDLSVIQENIKGCVAMINLLGTEKAEPLLLGTGYAVPRELAPNDNSEAIAEALNQIHDLALRNKFASLLSKQVSKKPKMETLVLTSMPKDSPLTPELIEFLIEEMKLAVNELETAKDDNLEEKVHDCLSLLSLCGPREDKEIANIALTYETVSSKWKFEATKEKVLEVYEKLKNTDLKEDLQPFVNPQKVKSNIQNELAQLKAKTKLGKLVGHIKKLNASGAAPDSPDVLAANDAFTKMAAMFEKSVGNTVSTSVTRLLKEADPAIDTSTWKAPLAPKEFNTFIETLPTAEIPAELQSIIGNDLRETMTAVVDTSESVSGVLPQSSTKETDGNEESSTSSDDGVPEEVGKKKKKTTNRMIRKLRKISDNTSLLERISGLECKEIFTSFEDFMKLPTCKLSKEDRKNWLENAAKKLKDKYDTWMWSKHCCSMFLDPEKRNERDYSMIVEFVDSSLDKDLIDEIVEKIKTHCTESSSTALIVSIPLTLMFLMLLLL